jgi:hypothetical protein
MESINGYFNGKLLRSDFLCENSETKQMINLSSKFKNIVIKGQFNLSIIKLIDGLLIDFDLIR